jgi:hypothetical protein
MRACVCRGGGTTNLPIIHPHFYCVNCVGGKNQHVYVYIYTWCGQNVCALNFFLQMWQHFRLLWKFGV